MEQNVRDRKPDAWMFYVVCDVSGSMHTPRSDGSVTPWQVMFDGLGDILFELNESPTARDICHMSVVAFSDSVEEVLPLTSLRCGDIYIPGLPKGGWTNYHAIFSWLNNAIPRDYERMSADHRVKRPAIYFITDGWPEVDNKMQQDSLWGKPLRQLQAYKSRPIITALGLGKAKKSSLCLIRSAPGEAWVADTDAVPAHLLSAIMDQIIQSVVRSSSSEGFVFDPPRGMKRVSC